MDDRVLKELHKDIDKNMASLNLEQDEWSKALHQMASLSTDIVLGRADIDKKCCKVEEKARVVEEEVWHRQASTASLNSSCTQSESHGGFGEPAQQKVRGKSWQEKVVENIQVKEVEMENLTEALVRSKKMVSELRTCHVSSDTHQQEIELKTELMEVEKMWIREKAELYSPTYPSYTTSSLPRGMGPKSKFGLSSSELLQEAVLSSTSNCLAPPSSHTFHHHSSSFNFTTELPDHNTTFSFDRSLDEFGLSTITRFIQL